MHSTTKYFGGHSDLLGGVLLTNDKEVAKSVSNTAKSTTISYSMGTYR
jgi:cystathionine beta-lyase/cystathionine gamma-synthase